ncbi:hypothetical protein [Legionella nagasakiensis]|uniref:hypothetical protein n=1 Tax=Legionella nagasakiensis TaxID=535290 RepID=UPI0010542BC6|nr:hypothetical protein [Legionella nagasakiensis]
MTLNILFLCNKPKFGNDANTIIDHINAFETYSKHKIWIYSNLGEMSKKLDLERFDAIIIHYSICLLHDYYLSKKSKERLREYKGLKIVFVQDEYRQINKMIAELAFLQIDILFTCFPTSEYDRIYSEDKLPGVKKCNNLTGYIPERLMKLTEQPLIVKRSIHVGYRGRKIPFWLGELSYEKYSIAERWIEKTSKSDLKTDISCEEKDRIYGEKWIEFLSSCKATLGVESGASVMDFTGNLEKVIDLHQLTHPNDSFFTVQKKYLLDHEGLYKLNQISPRCFEAIALKTVLVLYEGEYSGILIPWRHYIPLKKDFSNIDDIIIKLHDDLYLQSIADKAFEEIAQNPKYSYRSFIKSVDQTIEDEFLMRCKQKVNIPYKIDVYTHDIKYIPFKSKLYQKGLTCYQKFPLTIRLVIKGVLRPKFAIRYLFKHFFSIVRP